MQEYADLNRRLLQEFPELQARFQAEFGDWEEDERGPHVVYGDILIPYLEEAASHGDVGTLRRAANLVEALLSNGDHLTRELAEVTLCEAILDRDTLSLALQAHLGQLTQKTILRIAVEWGLERGA